MSNLTDLLPAGGGGKNVDFVATGTLASGQAVALKTDGTVTAITGQVGTATTFASGANATLNSGMCFDPDNNKVIIAYRDVSSSPYYGYAVVGTVSGMSISFGTPVAFYSSGSLNGDVTAVYDTTANKVVVTFYPQAGGLYAIVGTVSGTSISFGSTANISAAPSYSSSVYDSSANKTLVSYSNTYPTVVAISVSGTTPSFGTPVVVVSAATGGTSLSYDTTANKSSLVVTHQSSSYLKAYAITISGTTPSAGSATDLGTFSNGADGLSTAYNPDINRHIVVFRDRTSGASQYFSNYIIFQISGTSIINNTAATAFNNLNGGAPVVVYDTGSNKVVVLYNNASYTIAAKVGTATVSSITFGDQITVEPAINQYSIGAVYDSAADRVVVGSYGGSGIVFNAGGIPSTDFLGITDAAISSGASGSVTVKGGIVTNTSGLLPLSTTFGTGVVAKTGTVQALALAYDEDNYKVIKVVREGNVPYAYVGTVSGTSTSYGAASTPAGMISAIFHNNDSIVYDTTNNKFIFVYKDVSDGTKGKAVVGTVSGTSISWGTPVTFASPSGGVDHPTVAFDANAGKCLISYMDDSAGGNHAKALVGTVSGTSISFGTTVTMNASYTQDYAMAYDANAQKVVVAMMDRGDNYYGKARVATISGTDVSFGTTVTFFSAALTFDVLSATYDSTAQKVVIMFGPDSKDTRGIVGTVSGTNISFGTAAEVVDNDQYISFQSVAYNPTIGKVGVIFNSNSKTRFHLGTVSGTDISFGSESMVDENGAGDANDIVYEANAQKFVIAYSDAGNSNQGTAAVVSTSTDMTIGTTYYVQDDGTLGTTSSSVTAGKALSATSINLEYNS